MKFLRIDWMLFLPVAILVTISLVTLFSLNPVFFHSQFVSLLVALAAFVFFSQVNIDFLKKLSLPIYIISVIVLLITLAIGIESRGAVRWVDIFGVRLQFSEIVKPFLAISFASFVAQQQYPTFKSFMIAILLLTPVFLLVNFQPDLGNAILFGSVALFAMFIAGYSLRWFVLLFLPFVLSAPLIWANLHTYQQQRILTFLNPQADPLGISYNSIQALIAVGSGSWFGKGLSEGTQSSLRFLPERQTDFIFATIAEGLGLVGALIIILALVVLCYRIYQIFITSKDRFMRIFAACAFGFFLIPAFVNIGMNTGIVPIVGVTLPFVSFGGSSLLSNFIFLGLLSSMSISQRHKNVLEIR